MAQYLGDSDRSASEEKAVTGSTKIMVNGDDIFTIYNGPIKIIELVSVCISGNDGTASTVQYRADPTVGSATTISGATGSIADMGAGSAIRLNMTALNTAPDITADDGALAMLGGVQTNGIIVGAGIIELVIGTGSTSGTWKHYLRYAPLAPGVVVVGV